jgi:hypothetical protein
MADCGFSPHSLKHDVRDFGMGLYIVALVSFSANAWYEKLRRSEPTPAGAPSRVVFSMVNSFTISFLP